MDHQLSRASAFLPTRRPWSASIRLPLTFNSTSRAYTFPRSLWRHCSCHCLSRGSSSLSGRTWCGSFTQALSRSLSLRHGEVRVASTQECFNGGASRFFEDCDSDSSNWSVNWGAGRFCSGASSRDEVAGQVRATIQFQNQIFASLIAISSSKYWIWFNGEIHGSKFGFLTRIKEMRII
jgi:hypothetical protein